MLAERYDVEAAYNLALLPSAAACGRMHLRDDRCAHTGGHERYNAFVRAELDACDGTVAFVALLGVLHRGSRGRVRVPWW